ncbi:MAG: twin-arginine translocase TatA/TatE family subunit [Anaerolineales bacterium]
MGSIGTPELILILAVVLLLFGVGRISRIGGEMGSAVRAFREGISEDKDDKKDDQNASSST